MATQHDIRFTLYTSSSYHFDVISFKLLESLSEPFQLTLSVSSTDADVDFGQLLDEPITFTFWQDDKVQRRINGIISRVRQGQTGFRRTLYTFIIEPELVRTQLRSNCRIFQQKDVTEIITELLKESGNKNVTFDTHESHSPREYCVQYRETDFDFIKRLAAEEGLVYTFEHAKDQHHLIFSDQLHHGPVQSEVLYNPKPSAQQPEPALRKFDYTEQLNTDEHRMRDYTFTHPRYNLEHSHHGHNNLHTKDGKRAEYQKFDYPGRYKADAQGAPFNRYRLEYERRDSQQVTAHGDDMRPQPGHVIALNQHDNWHFTGNWLVTSIEHSGQQPQSQGEDSASSETGSRYNSTLTLIPHGQAWRAEPDNKPSVDGAHIAHVVGPAGEEIYTDEYGRVKVQFPWDRYGSRDEHSSCWIRVSQDLGGGTWGHMAIPRIGHEVIVDFLEGDPDQPIITGRTYHANNMPPYALPEHKTRTTIKSQTHKGIGYNELRFEDEAKQEEIFIHAQKDQNNIVQNDETTRVGHDRTEDIGNDETINIGRDRTEDVLNDETLSVVQDQRETIGRDRFQVIERNRITRIDKDFIEKVNNHRVESTYANHHEEVGGHYVHTVNGNYSLEVVDTITSQTTKHISSASEKMHIQGPGGSITIDSGGVTFKASHINIQAGSVAFNGPSSGSVNAPNFDPNIGKAFDAITAYNKADTNLDTFVAEQIRQTIDTGEIEKFPVVTNLAWSQPKVPVGEEVTAMFTAKDFKGGETATIKVYEIDNDNQENLVDTLTTQLTSETGSYFVPWSRKGNEVDKDLEEDQGNKYSQDKAQPLEYKFDVEVSSVKSTHKSGPLQLTKNVIINAEYEDGTPIVDGTQVVLVSASGDRHVENVDQGKVSFKDVVVGPVHISLTDSTHRGEK